MIHIIYFVVRWSNLWMQRFLWKCAQRRTLGKTLFLALWIDFLLEFLVQTFSLIDFLLYYSISVKSFTKTINNGNSTLSTNDYVAPTRKILLKWGKSKYVLGKVQKCAGKVKKLRIAKTIARVKKTNNRQRWFREMLHQFTVWPGLFEKKHVTRLE